MVSEDLLPRQEEGSVVEVEEGVLLLETFGVSAVNSGLTVSSSVFSLFSGVTRVFKVRSFNGYFGCLALTKRGGFVADFEIAFGLIDLDLFLLVFETVMVLF